MSKISKILEQKDTEIQETDELSYNDLAQEDKDFLIRNGFDDMPKHMFSLVANDFFETFHGTIMSIGKNNTLRLTKEDLVKIIKDDKFRFIDVKNIGF